MYKAVPEIAESTEKLKTLMKTFKYSYQRQRLYILKRRRRRIMIQSLDVKGLNGRFDYGFEFYEDFNIFAGHIGTGKTTLLKLIWFLTSGNLHRVISEIPFQDISIETSEFSLSMQMTQDNSDQVKLGWKFAKETKNSEVLLPLSRESSMSVSLKEESDVHDLNNQINKVMSSSLFFPTFRRMERHFAWDLLGEPLDQLADDLSVDAHKFITAVSTYDLTDLLKEKYDQVTTDNSQDNDADNTLYERWSKLTQIVKDIYEIGYDGIKFSDNLIFDFDPNSNGKIPFIKKLASTDQVGLSPNSRGIIPVENLSSGEKQLLGFLCYNAFSEAKTIFIDEPELSLHSDWQQRLLRLLNIQGTEKQFFVATHSIVHIVAQYQDKKHLLERQELTRS